MDNHRPWHVRPQATAHVLSVASTIRHVFSSLAYLRAARRHLKSIALHTT